MKWLTTIIKNQKIRRLVALSIDLYHRARSHPGFDDFTKDPDRAFKTLVRTAAKLAGWKISDAEVDIIHMEVARVVMGKATDQLDRELKEIEAMFERIKGKI